MPTAIVLALISGAVALGAAAVSVFSARSVARLQSRLALQDAERTKKEQAEQLRDRYRAPLLSAVFDLQSRLYNVVINRFLARYLHCDDAWSCAYAAENTLHVLAEYLGWVEIIRREIQFLDLGAEMTNRRWVGTLEQVHDILARDDIDPTLRLFRGEQRAIGELMTLAVDEPAGARRHECLGYATFMVRAQEPEFARWFQKLRGDLELLATESEARLARLVLLQRALVDVLDVLDPDCERFPAQRRGRLALARPEVAHEAPAS